MNDWSPGLHRSLVKVGVHARRGCRLDQLLFEHLSNVWVLVVVFYLVSAGFHVLVDFSDIAKAFTKTVFDSTQTRRQVTCTFSAGVEMLVPHHCRGREDTAILPIVTFDRFAFSPEERETLTLNNNDIEARAMTVGFLVGTNRKF